MEILIEINYTNSCPAFDTTHGLIIVRAAVPPEQEALHWRITHGKYRAR
jgi:hypothetical protein